MLRERTSKFQAYLPIIQTLASPALNIRHWQQLSELIGEVIDPEDELSLDQLLELKIVDYFEPIQGICGVAEKVGCFVESIFNCLNLNICI